MKSEQIVKFISIPAKVVTYLLLLLTAVLIIQAMALGIAEEYFRKHYVIDPARKVKYAPKPKLTEAEKKQRAMNKAAKEVLPDGTIHLVQKEKSPERVKTIYSVDGDILWERESDEKPPYKYIEWAQNQRRNSIDSRQMKQAYGIRVEFSRSVIVPVLSGDKDRNNILERWRYEPMTDTFTGFDIDSYGIGFMGSNGFVESADDAKPFGKFVNITAWSRTPFSSPFLLWQTGKKLYQIDFESRKVEIVFDAGDDKIGHTTFHNWHVSSEYDKPGSPMIYISTKSRKHYLLTKYPRQQIELNISEEFDKGGIDIGVYQDEIFLKHHGTKGEPSSFDIKARKKWFQELMNDSRDITRYFDVYKLDQDATPVLIDGFQWRAPFRTKKQRQQSQNRELFMERVKKYQTSISPILYKLARDRIIDRRWQEPKYHSEIARTFFELIDFLHPTHFVLSCIVSAVMVVLAGVHGWSRRRGWGEYVFWLVFVAAFNVAGLLAYISLKHTVVIRCSGCGKRRGLEREDCPACGLELPEPARREVDLIGVSS